MAIAVENLLTTDILRPARYLGNELGAVHKDWETTVVRWVLTYPEVYEVGASNLGHIILYSILNTQPRQLCDRAYLPAPDLSTKLRETQTPLFAVESRRPLTDFDILGFSLSYELGATNILEMLDLAGIPLTWRERSESDPLIFAGGQTATSNPEPYADFFDFVALGDGEELLPEIGLVLEEGKLAGLSREDLLFDLAQIPGVYVPRFYDMAADGSVHPNRPDVPKRILRRVATPIPAYSIGLVPYVQTVHDRLTIEIRRGCTRGCRFCQPGMLTRPARDVEPEQVVEAIESGMRATGYNEFSLLSLSCSDYLALPAVGVEIKNRLHGENISLSLPSQRVDRFDENIANIIGGTRQIGITFAPEAGTQRMRDIVNKGLTNEELLRGVKTAVEQGWDKVKLYFMIGLPGETDEDVLGIADTIRWLRRECSKQGRRRLDFNITISNFTPKPHTPFQWHSVSTSEFKRKQELLKEAFRAIRGTKVNFTDTRISAMEDFVGRGDRRLAPVVKRAWELGAGMDSWWESVEKAFGAWTQSIEESGLTWKYRQVDSGEWNIFEASESISLDAPLPWDHLDTGIDKKWLQEDLQKALEAAIVPDCSFEGCSHCGVCGVDFGHNIVIPPPEIPEFTGHFVPNQTRAQRIRVRMGKEGEMALLSHLDLMRLFDRAVRRASIPLTFTGGFHPQPRIVPASALPLGVSSSGEIVDFELTEPMSIEEFRTKLAAQLPADMPIYEVQDVDPKQPAAAVLLQKAEYRLEIAGDQGNWQDWIEQILAKSEILLEHTTKSGKTYPLNMRDRLFELELLESSSDRAIVRYVGSCQNDGTLLKPEQLVSIFEQVSQQELHLLTIHRIQLVLA
ncbi:radical SAM domain-containing protein [Leptolyngbya boryana NIES-2135]|uniref:Radical SAM domain-containing protein n=1 Tax=Leptolyngbya boryana NIES-2135 TaxID=1973484 RepID=A0A1Z4JIA1_LEPBY|nr:TIGR03960 family B12-binding radical SAM protein [Leptolyngbya boryana]MBD2371197.1 TIGR03960 family B12-binding radical SAM protein [Leptolyngbya sp. FACHB-161]MBD2377656.1 TIGR03960 family B12-binding radical SAM protein [Leptolyngbya sp. FACHB-238]MBD2402108.1 TIGR03960 family B12-binding radical SAM protein [Leptolyngbya sp. FACHB-239]MBD2408628.1 TIGR03960 family B12-binding radical SAM protein [Leptolyngbya sp. FACHB-402]BAY56474.1 radical SAM domain-containing protein [Leptolyngbya b